MDSTLVSKVEPVVRKAGAKLMEFWPGKIELKGKLKEQTKADGSIVTEADFASNEIIVSALKSLFPSDAILSEELPPPDLKPGQAYWIIDPLDGTKMFATGREDFAVLVAYCREGKAQLGFMYYPVVDELLWGGPELGSFRVLGKGKVEKISVAKNAQIEERGFLYRVWGQTQAIDYGDKRIDGHVLDSCRMCHRVAVGEVQGLALMKLAEWDLAAPDAVLSGAGAQISTETGAPVIYPGKGEYIKWFIASNRFCHDEALSKIIPLVINK